MLCTSCGVTIPTGARFCPSCGTSTAGSDEERRVITVLFADIVGFTALSESMDPEEVKRLVDRCFERLARDITAFGGVVDKVLGDAIVALFGAPIAHEDDAERAVRAGLRMQQSLRNMSDDAGHQIRMRIGINTGEVLVGTSSAGGDYTAMGDVMNSASRLEGLADPGRVLVGQATYLATRESISYSQVGLLEARGREEGIETWMVLRATRPPGMRTRPSTDFVGRDYELDLIFAQARAAIELKRAQSTLILGEAGMGKARVAREAANLIANHWGAQVFAGRALPYGEANVWWPIGDIVRSAFFISYDASAEEARAILTNSLPSHLAAKAVSDIPRTVTALMHALGYETPLRGGDGTNNRAEVTLAMTRLLEAELARRPVVIMLNDMHWAGEPIWDLVGHMLTEHCQSQLIILMTARASETLDLPQGRHGSLVLQLGPLDEDSSRALLAQLGVDLPDDVSAELVERSGGNPFFLEELAEFVTHQRKGEESEVVAEMGSGRLGSMPDSLRGLVAARLDQLDSRSRTVLEAASVLGRSGPVDGLRTMIKNSLGFESISAELTNLINDDLLKISGQRYEFRSDMIRDVAYGTLTKTVRAQSHEGIARYLEKAVAVGEPRNSAVVVIADHYRQAAQLTRELSNVAGLDRDYVTDRALHWLAEAGRRALAADEPIEAERWYSAGLDLVSLDPIRSQFLYGRAKARCEVRDIVGCRNDLDRLDDIVDADDLLAAKAMLVRGDIDRKANDLDQAVDRLAQAADRLHELGDHAEEALALRLLGLAEVFRSDRETATAALEEAVRVAGESGERREEGWALQSLAWFMFRVGRIREAQRLIKMAEEIFTELNDRGGLAWTQGLAAWVAFHLGEWDRARSLIDTVLPETRRRGDDWAEAIILTLLGSLELWEGHAYRALEVARQSQMVGERAKDIGLMVDGKTVEGRALVSRKRVVEGTAALEMAYNMAERDRDVEASRRAVIANCSSAARLGESERVIRWAARFDEDQADMELLGARDLSVSLALALLQRGALEEAEQQLHWIDEDESESGVDDYNSYALAVSAMIAAAKGDLLATEERARRVLEGTSTYLDRVFARLALALRDSILSDQSGIDHQLEAARSIVRGTDDLLTPLMIDHAGGVLGRNDLEKAEAALRAADVDPDGWNRVWSLTKPSETVETVFP